MAPETESTEVQLLAGMIKIGGWGAGRRRKGVVLIIIEATFLPLNL
jgi:hypothetical protein